MWGGGVLGLFVWGWILCELGVGVGLVGAFGAVGWWGVFSGWGFFWAFLTRGPSEDFHCLSKQWLTPEF